MTRLKSFFGITLVVVILLSAMMLNYKKNFHIEKYLSFVNTIAEPIQSCLTGIESGVGHTVNVIPRIGGMEKENQRQKETIEKLNAKLRRYQEYKTENDRLYKLLDLKKQYWYLDMKAAQLIAADPETWFSMFTINRGVKSGVRKNMPVITNGGLVGYTVSASSYNAKVLSILDTDCSVGAIIERTRDIGIVCGDENIKSNGYVRMNYINLQSRVSVGDTVVTSGIGGSGGIFPKGINIGKIVSIKKDADQLTKYAIIKPDVDFNKIENVLVVTKK